jgi:hypothetical protein
MNVSIKIFQKVSNQSDFYNLLDRLNFSDLQNVILGSLTILIPLLIYFFSAEYSKKKEYKLILNELEKKIEWEKLILFIPLSLLFLSLNFENILYKLLVIIIFTYTIILLYKISIYLFKIVFKKGSQALVYALTSKHIPIDKKVEIWRDVVWESKDGKVKNFEREEEKQLGNIFLMQLNDLFESLQQKLKISVVSSDYKNFKNLLYSYTHNNVVFLDEGKIDEIDETTSYKMINSFYTDELYNWVNEKYLINKKPNLDHILRDAQTRILKVAFNKSNHTYEIFSDTFSLESEGSDVDSKKKVFIFQNFFKILFTIEDSKKIKNILYSAGNLILEEIELNKSLTTSAFLNEFQDLEEDRKKIIIEEIFDDYNKRYIHMIFAFLHYGFEIPVMDKPFIYDSFAYSVGPDEDHALVEKEGRKIQKDKTFKLFKSIFHYYWVGFLGKLKKENQTDIYKIEDGQTSFKDSDWIIDVVNFFMNEVKKSNTKYTKEYFEIFKEFHEYLKNEK